MKKTAFILAALLTGASLSRADATATSSYSVTADFPYASKYVFRGIQYAEDSFQPSIKLTTGGLYVGLWTNQPITKNLDNEIDLYAGYNFAIADGWSLDVGGTYYYYPEADTNAGLLEHTFEAYAGITGSVEGVSLGAYVYNDFDLEALTVQGNIGYSIPINAKSSANLSASVGRVNPDAGDDYTYYSASLQFPYKLTDTATLTGGVNWASHDLDGVDDNHVWVNVGLTVTF